MSTGTPGLSVVVACHNACATVGTCLEALVRQTSAGDVEILVVDNSTDGSGEVIAAHPARVEVIRRPEHHLIPELWAAGIRRARAPVIAVTTAHCVPAASWVAEMLRAQGGSAPAVGGAIEWGGSSRLVDWAIYFCRYSQYMLPFSHGPVSDIPGDNACYTREVLERYADTWADGFWEHKLHARMRADGLILLADPSVVVSYRRSFGPLSFARQRFRHGRIFGGMRIGSASLLQRTVRLGALPLVPWLMAARIVVRVVGKRRYVGRLVVALPWVLWFLLAWSAGEAVGFLLGDRSRAGREGPRNARCASGA